MNKFKFDYNEKEYDAVILKNLLIEKLQVLNTWKDMETYIQEGLKGFDTSFWWDVYTKVAEQFQVKYFRDVENMNWYVDYFDSIAGKELSKEMNKGLITKKRKNADLEKFFNQYKLV